MKNGLRSSLCTKAISPVVSFLIVLLGLAPAPLVSATPAPLTPPPAVQSSASGNSSSYSEWYAGTGGAGTSPSRYGPNRTSPDAGIPRHAYSPFDKQDEPEQQNQVVAGQVLIKFRKESVETAGESLAVESTVSSRLFQNHNITSLEPVLPKAGTASFEAGTNAASGTSQGLERWFAGTLAPGVSVSSAVESLGKEASVEAVEPVFLRRLAGSSVNITDPLYGQQWHLSAIRAPEAWQFLSDNGTNPGGRRDIIVAVIDTGVDYNHPDLMGNIWTNGGEVAGNSIDDDNNGFVDDIHGVNVVSNLRTGDPMDDHGHGTHVAGIIAAQGNNSIGIVGVAYNVQIMPIKAAQYSGVLSTTDIAEAIYYAVEKGADVINMSFGGYVKSQLEEDALAVAFGQAVLVAAAGNDGQKTERAPNVPWRPMYPAAYNWVLGVMASSQGGGLASFSNYDPFPRTSYEYELMAPGVDILSTLPNGQYAAWDGTSMAAPVVSGIAALLRSHFKDKDVYSSRFIMGQIATAGADAYRALTEYPRPKLTYLEHWLFDTSNQSAVNDDDGIVDAGETIELAIVVRNHWGKADNVTVSLRAWAEGAFQDDPFITVTTANVSYGAIGSFNWDDNGLIYDAEGVITGVRNPFRFIASANTTNDHVIPFLLTMTAKNGLDPGDNTTYSFQSRFNLMVQRGRELPRIISSNMTLTKEDFWIVPGQTLVESGVTVNITAGTQVQWGTPTPNDPYSEPTTPMIQVNGTLLVEGTFDQPVEFFPSPILGGNVNIKAKSVGGTADLKYVKIQSPFLSVNSLDHGYLNGSHPSWGGFDFDSLTNSIIDKLGHGAPYYPLGSAQNWGFSRIETSLFDNVFIDKIYRRAYLPADTKNNVFLTDIGAVLGLTLGVNNQEEANANTRSVNNAFLSRYWDPDISKWVRLAPYGYGTGPSYAITHNYFGTTSTVLIDALMRDYNDDFALPRIYYQPILAVPAESTYPFVWKVDIAQGSQNVTRLGPGPAAFTVTFNRDMDVTVQPQVSFGPDMPVTDYTIHPIAGGWQNARTWVGTFNITPITGDGYQLMRIAGPARAASDPWLVIGDDSGRFRFEIITSGTEAMNLQATGGEGYVDLMWTQDDFDMLAGYNLYRSTSAQGTYTRLNSTVMPAAQKTYRDSNVQPGQPYYYKFTVVKTGMDESSFSNTATATPLDTIPPVIVHTPLSSASFGTGLQIYADVTDNVRVASVKLYYRPVGVSMYQTREMVKTTGNRYSATLEGSLVTAPGLEYYIEASDGVSTVRHGRQDNPYRVTVVDAPQVTVAVPNQGPSSGNTSVTISGSNFKTGASVTFGGAAASNVTLLSANQLTAVTPPHFPAVVDVRVTNADGQSGVLLKGFTYFSEVALLSLPDTGGEPQAIAQVPVNAMNVQGLVAASLTVNFDSRVLSARGARTGSLTPGWSLAANTNTPGEVRLSLASTAGSVSGSGVLAYIDFDVVGASGNTTALLLGSILLNDGAIPVQATSGSFVVTTGYSISGMVRAWSSGAGVPGVQLSLSGSRDYSGVSQADGGYRIGGIFQGDYTLTPAKSDNATSISAYDASLVLQHDVGLITLTSYAATAADVNKSGAINSMDAYYILEKAVDLIALPFPGAGAVWEFAPPSRSYTSVSADHTDQDFTAILLGDVSGDWSRVQSQSIAMSVASAELAAGSVTSLSSAKASLPLNLTLQGGELYSADIVLTYDNTTVSAVSVNRTWLSENFTVVSNLSVPGRVRIAMAGARPITSNGALLTLTFDAIGGAGTSTVIRIASAALNESAIPTWFTDGRLTIVHEGDATSDGALDARDITKVERIIARLDLPSAGADANRDGQMDAVDVARVERIIAGLD